MNSGVWLGLVWSCYRLSVVTVVLTKLLRCSPRGVRKEERLYPGCVSTCWEKRPLVLKAHVFIILSGWGGGRLFILIRIRHLSSWMELLDSEAGESELREKEGRLGPWDGNLEPV